MGTIVVGDRIDSTPGHKLGQKMSEVQKRLRISRTWEVDMKEVDKKYTTKDDRTQTDLKTLKMEKLYR
ncbi:hypothetical protein RUM44_011254 [Polyplax serrata]|uniref:Uncharacterized protein n=1 Tax=Polyplax serrata TaxID=468196 RepID=A0ABR1APK5_POLSC